MDSNQFTNALQQISEKPIPVINSEIPYNKYVSISISKENQELHTFTISSSKEWQNYLQNYLKKNNAKVAFGGYLEVRNIYERSSYFSEQKRNIHLGIDLWCAKNTKVLAALDGQVHSFKLNDNYGDYGPTIILKHQIQNEIFYTLYGHLSKKSLKNISIGDTVLQGSTIGSLGSSAVNGNYASHLHFQIIRDLQGNFGDYPGVSSSENLEFYKQNCPDPNLLLKL